MMADANKMQGERDISPAATRARKAAYAQTLGRLNARNRPRAKTGTVRRPRARADHSTSEMDAAAAQRVRRVRVRQSHRARRLRRREATQAA
jgi:hypothetical protein